MTPADPHSKRRAEVAALSVAIVRTLGRIDRARAELSNLERRLAAQEAEYRFQKLILRTPYAAPHKPEGNHP